MSATTARNIIATAAVTVLAVGSLTAVSSAASQYGTACADNKTGALRVLVPAAKECTAKEQPVGLGSAMSGTTFSYIDRYVTVPASATEWVEYRAECPAGSHIVNGSVRSLTHNAYYSTGNQYADESNGTSAWVFGAQHVDPTSPREYYPEHVDPAADAVAHLRLVCAS